MNKMLNSDGAAVKSVVDAVAGTWYECGVVGCNALTLGVYCDAHRESCDECGAECEKNTRIAFVPRKMPQVQLLWCDDCARLECDYEMKRGLSLCWCGMHKAVR
jgi:hypothetical protein